MNYKNTLIYLAVLFVSLNVLADNIKVKQEQIIGGWKWSKGNEVRVFKKDGGFEMHGDDADYASHASGTWMLSGNIVTIKSTTKNKSKKSGKTITVTNEFAYTIVSITDDKLILYMEMFDSTSEWLKVR